MRHFHFCHSVVFHCLLEKVQTPPQGFKVLWGLVPTYLSSLISHTSAPTFSTSTIANCQFCGLTPFSGCQSCLVGTFFTSLHLQSSSFRFSVDSHSSGNLSILQVIFPYSSYQFSHILYLAQHSTSHMVLKLICLYLLSLLTINSLRPGSLSILFPFSISSIQQVQ